MLDYTKIKKKLNPKPDGEDTLRLRTGVVSAINANGTADVVISGVTVPGVPRLAEASLAVGAIVQILAYRGSFLIIGRAAQGAQSAGLGLWARGQSTSNSATLPTTQTLLLSTNTVTFIKNRVYEVKTHGGFQSTTAGQYADMRVYRTAAATQLGEFFRFPIPSANAAFNASAAGLYFTVAANTVGAISLYAAASAAATTFVHTGTSGGTPRNVEVWDVGDSSQFSGIATY